MADRMKVIQGLMCCKHWDWDKTSWQWCSGCPYAPLEGGSCKLNNLEELFDDAIALLKAQEARMMTLEEVKELHPDDDVYIERISSITGVHYIYATTIWRVVSKSIKFCPDNATLWFSEYGETWRCWTSRPTDAQREATPWQ